LKACLPEAQVTIFNQDLDVTVTNAINCLSADERERADKFIFPVHRNRFVMGRHWLRQVLGGTLGIDPNKVNLTELEFGKPVLAKGKLFFNLSHADNKAVLAVSETCQIGIDLEAYRRKVDIDALAKNYFTKAEIAWLMRLPAEKKTQGFFALWTAKEARMKITGEGFHLPATQIEVEFNADQPVAYRQPRKPKVWLTTINTFAPDMSCTLATSQPVAHLIIDES